MVNPLQDALLDRLSAEGRDGDALVWMVLTAAESAEALDRLLADGAPARRPRARERDGGDGDVARTFLGNVELRSFRGIGPDALLPIEPGCGVTLVVGRNGSGKSSFAEAIEVAFTGTSERWRRKGNKEWTRGWLNVHGEHAPRIVVRLAQEGAPGTRIERTWDDPAKIDSGRSRYVDAAGTAQELAASHWPAALDDYRPFLSYSELGDMLADGPSRIYQALLAGLGLDGYELTRQRLANALNDRTKQARDARRTGKELAASAREQSTRHDEETRFGVVADLLKAKEPDLDRLATLAADGDGGDDAAPLVALARAGAPFTQDALAGAVATLAAAADNLAATRADAAGRADDVARLLALAIDCAHRQPFATCPVCGAARPLDDAWQTAARTALEDAQARAAQARAAAAARTEARHALDAMVAAVPEPLARAAQSGWEPAVTLHARWSAWCEALPPEDAGRGTVVTHEMPTLCDAYAALQAAAADQVRRRQDVWRPFGVELAAWVVEARQAAAARTLLPDLERARDWVAAEIERHRDERFAPIKAQAIEFWNVISRYSNLTLVDIELTGQGKQQRVTLKVQVDGTDAPALGVMSQGELNAMTLSLFLPRVLLPQSPFGFVVVDDPVQAMDTARVDGLARVLARVGEARQVVVFTHDDRLADAFRLLGLPHRPLRVVRQAASTVVVTSGEGPVELHLRDANAVARTEGVPDGLSAQVVPAFCRLALEAAVAETLRKRWLGAGMAHEEVATRLDDKGLTPLLAYLFFENQERRHDVAARLGRVDVPDAAAVVADCQAGAHSRFSGDPVELVKRTRKLCEALRRVTPAERARR